MRVVLASNNIELLTYSHKNKLIDLSPNENKPPYVMKFSIAASPRSSDGLEDGPPQPATVARRQSSGPARHNPVAGQRVKAQVGRLALAQVYYDRTIEEKGRGSV